MTANSTPTHEQIADIVRDHLTAVYACTRVWSAWSYGTMGPDDFIEASETEMADEIAAAVLERLSQPVTTSDAEPMYYLQDTRSYVGNCPMWWALNGNGYTTRLDEAQRYTFDEAMRQHNSRPSDVPWPCEQIDALRRPTVDMQHMGSHDVHLEGMQQLYASHHIARQT